VQHAHVGWDARRIEDADTAEGHVITWWGGGDAGCIGEISKYRQSTGATLERTLATVAMTQPGTDRNEHRDATDDAKHE
jgi:hypothetical protein